MTLLSEKARLHAARADRIELERLIRSGELVHVDEFGEGLQSVVSIAVATITALRSMVGEVQCCMTADQVRVVLSERVRSMTTELRAAADQRLPGSLSKVG